MVSIANFEAGDSGIRVTAGGETDAAEALRRVAELATTQKLVIPIDKLYTFDQAAEAFRLSRGRTRPGQAGAHPATRERLSVQTPLVACVLDGQGAARVKP